ncbi:hypothetical protein NPIL_155561 [Nephila pilipes]|uniref:Uncharacterized protein n=1 Tax=Nephila pilipes TaxID=299642 RepID=A0A8X6Q9I5_NEPPI|nr:hypothetical protein NPIL_155561 [Nephila pilipes]
MIFPSTKSYRIRNKFKLEELSENRFAKFSEETFPETNFEATCLESILKVNIQENEEEDMRRGELNKRCHWLASTHVTDQ